MAAWNLPCADYATRNQRRKKSSIGLNHLRLNTSSTCWPSGMLKSQSLQLSQSSFAPRRLCEVMNQELEPFYRELLETVAVASGSWRSVHLCGFVALKGTMYENGLLVVGRATN